MMKLSEFNYYLPKELIAQKPLSKRDSSRLMVLDRKRKIVKGRSFSDITDYMRKGDLLVLNDTRVVPGRLYGKRKTGAKVEIFLLNTGPETVSALVRPSKRIKCGERIELSGGMEAVVHGASNPGRFVQFNAPMEKVLKEAHLPLPPYITRPDTDEDKTAYQTVYAREDGATASPTAGLHFTMPLLEKIREKGISIAHVTLHASYGTFAPVKEKNIENHRTHAEYYSMSRETADLINRTKKERGQIIAVGSTSTRVLESSINKRKEAVSSSGKTNLFIFPGYTFKMVDKIITNFHMPESTLLMLVSAFAGRDFLFGAYRMAIGERYRFFSYGDAMMII